MKVLLAVDGSDYTKRMLAYLAAHDELLSKTCEYIALTVVAPVPRFATQFMERRTLDDYYHDEADQVLKPIIAFAEMQSWPLRIIKTHGQAAQTIAEIAREENPALIVMGSHGHSALANVAMGSVTASVLARCTIPVLLIR